MQELVGQCFSLADEQYRIVDVRFIGSDSMVYAERADAQGRTIVQPRRPQRAAFHYADIAPYLGS